MYHRKLTMNALTRMALVGLLVASGSLQANVDLKQSFPDLSESHGLAGSIVIDLADYFESDVPLPLSYSLVDNSDPSIASAVLSGSQLTITMNAGFVGTTQIEVEADDTDGSRAEKFDVEATNQAPATFTTSIDNVTNPGLGLVEDSAVGWSLNLAVVDADVLAGNDAVTVTEVSNSGPAIYTASIQPDGRVLMVQNPDANGTQTLVYQIEDLLGATGTVSVDIIVDAVNDQPVAIGTINDITMDEDDAPLFVSFAGVFTDVDVLYEGDSFTSVGTSDNPGLVNVVPVAAGAGVTLALAPDRNGVANIQVRLEDAGLLQSAPVSFTLTVNQVNDPVVVIGSIPDRLLNEDASTISVNVSGVFDDLDLALGGDSHTLTVTGNTDPALVTPVITSLAGLNGTFQFDITPDLDGTSTITIQAEDAGGTTADVSFNIDVVALNDPPFVAAPLADQTHTEDAGNLSIDFAGVFDDIDLTTQTDVQGFDYSLNNSTLVTSASIAGTTLNLGFGQNQNGTVSITLQVTDKGGLVATDTFDLVVAAVPDAPEVVNPIGTIGENEDAPDTIIDLDTVFDDADILTDGDMLTYTILSNSNPALFDAVDITGSSLTLEYAGNQFGTASISIEARDMTGLTVTDTFTVSVTEIFPIPQDDVVTINEDDDPILIDVLANDFLGEEPTIILSIGRNWPDDANPLFSDVTNSDPTTQYDAGGVQVTAPNGYLTVVGGMIEYQPKEDFSGNDYFEYSIQDADGDIAVARVDITVVAQDDAPRVFSIPEYTVNQGSFLDIQAEGGLLSYAVDDDGDPLEVRYLTVPTQIAPGGFVPDLSGNGAFEYTPIATYGAVPGQTDSFQIYYWDEADGLASPPVTVIINFDPDEGGVAPPPAGEVEFDFDLADVPLEDAVAAEANVLIMMDDSGSMDWGVMTPDAEGRFAISNSGTRRNGVRSYANSFRYTVQLDTNINGGNSNVPTEETLAADTDFDGNDYGVWRARSAQFSTIYYNPEIRYTPWIGLDRDGNEFADVDPNAAPLDPYDAAVNTIDLETPITFLSDNVPGTRTRRKDVTNSNVYLPYYYDTTATDAPDWDDPNAKVTIDGTFPVVLASGASVNYYPGGAARADCAADDDDPTTCTFEQELQNFANWFSYYRSREYSSKAALGRAISSASNIRMGYAVLNNASERMPLDSLNASYRVGHKRDLMDQVYKIVSNGSTPLRRALDRAGRHFECRSGDAFGSNSSSSPGDPECPILPSPEGQCQNNFTLLFSDGTWNGGFTGSNHDADGGSPDPSSSPFDGGMFEDDRNPSLADIAMYYYERDLHPGLENGVPTTERDQNWAPVSAFENEGEIMHQHMKTYTVGFGVQGTVDFDDLPLDYTQPFDWPDPFAQGLAKIDDMLHAAVNGRGEFLQANNPILLSQAFSEAFEDFSDGSVSVSAVAFNSTALREETVEYRGFFNLKFNSGDLRALEVDSVDGVVDNANPLWQASVQLDSIDPSTRKIVTWDAQTEEGIPFEYASLNSDQLAILSQDELEWLRGERDEEEPNGILRSREDVEGLLGDIVHSAPQFVGAPRAFRRDQYPYPTSELYSEFAADSADRRRVVYVAANDGMLHGFDAGADASDYGTGDEVFAYVPNKIIDASQRFANDLDQLTSLVYSHRYFVDLTPSVEDIFTRASDGAATKSWNTIMLGGLAGGGKGYFALNVTDPDSSYATVANAEDVVLWEFTDENDRYPVDSAGDPLVDGSGNPLLDLTGAPVKDLGYTFAQPQIVMTNAEDLNGEKIWMAVFGNGYNSTAGIGKLFLLDIDGGIDGWDDDEIIKVTTDEGVKSSPDPLAGLPNGIGTAALVDDDANGTADRAYAGDLFGNLYRFDISDSNPDNWSAVKIFQATYDGTAATRQPITTQPYVFAHPEAGFMVVFATGSYITEQDGTSTDIQSVYGIWDRDEDPASTNDPGAKFDRLVEQTVTNIIDESNGLFERQRLTSGNEVAYEPDDNSGNEGVYGWYIDLDMPRPATTAQGNPNTDVSGNAPPAAQYPGERAIRRIIARGDALLLSTVIPRDANTCFRAPPGAVWPIDRLTGGNPSRPILDINNDGVIDDGDLIEFNGQLYATGILFDQDDLDGTLVDPSLLVGSGDEDFLFLSGGDDQITLRIAGPQDSKTGRLSWRELNEVN